MAQISEQKVKATESIAFIAGQVDQINREISNLETKKKHFLYCLDRVIATAKAFDDEAVKLPGENQ